MITQQLTINQQAGHATLIVKADQEGIQGLADLAEELSEREGITTNGTITYLPPPEPPPME